MIPEDVYTVVVSNFLKTTGPHLIEPDVGNQTNSRYKLRSHTQQENRVKNTDHP